MSEEKKQKLKEYQKNIEKQKRQSIIIINNNLIVYVLFFQQNYSSLSVSDSASSLEWLPDSLYSKSLLI